MAIVNTVNDFLGVFRMDELTYPRLCGGTFLTLLLKVRKQRVGIRERYENKRDPFSESNTFAGLIKTTKPDYIPPEDQMNDIIERERKLLKTVTSNYKNCNNAEDSLSIPFHSQPVSDAFDVLVTSKYEEALRGMQNFAESFIDESGSHWLVEKLLGLIESDESIADNDEFYVNYNGPAKKSELCSQPNMELHIHLSAFLLGVWHFVITKRKNNAIGRKTVDEWHGKFNEKDKRGKFKCPDELGAKWKNKIKLVDTLADANNAVCVEVEGLANTTKDNDFLAKSAKYESALKEFERAIFECQFSEFVNSEPLLEFTAKSEEDASRQKSRYIAYKNRMRDSAEKTYGAWSEQAKYFEYSQDEELPYTHKFLTQTLLNRSEQLVDVLTTTTLPNIEALDLYMYDDISALKDKLNSYNKFLKKHLKNEGNHFIYYIEPVVYVEKNIEENLSGQDMGCILAEHGIILNKRIESIENFLIDEDMELDDEIDNLMAFHATTRRCRAEIKSLYHDISE